MKPRFYVMDHRARCKHCGKKPAFYSYTHGANYSSIRSIKGVNRFMTDVRYLPDLNHYLTESEKIDDKEFMRRVNVRGVCSMNPILFKRKPGGFASYRIIFTCECRQSIWMFPVNSFDDNYANRKLVGNPYVYKEAGYIGKVNVRW